MANPPIKDRLESSFFLAQPAPVRTTLTAVLRSDGAHIGKFSAPSDAILALKRALNIVQPKLAALGMKQVAATRTYDADTAAAVLAYKKANGIKRDGQDWDDICGRMTLARLDTELKNSQTPGVVPPAPVTGPKPVDILVQIHGINPSDARAGTETADDVFGNIAFMRQQVVTAEYLAQRSFVVINFFGAGQQKSPTDLIRTRITDALKAAGAGSRLVVIGSSIFGKNAANLVLKIQGTLKPTYVALCDAGWDNARDPDLVGGIQAEEADSFYEAASNDWADVIGFVEFHGPAIGTRDRNVENRSPAVYLTAKSGIQALRLTPGGSLPGPRTATAAAARGIFKTVHDQAVADGMNLAIATAARKLAL